MNDDADSGSSRILRVPPIRTIRQMRSNLDLEMVVDYDADKGKDKVRLHFSEFDSSRLIVMRRNGKRSEWVSYPSTACPPERVHIEYDRLRKLILDRKDSDLLDDLEGYFLEIEDDINQEYPFPQDSTNPIEIFFHHSRGFLHGNYPFRERALIALETVGIELCTVRAFARLEYWKDLKPEVLERFKVRSSSGKKADVKFTEKGRKVYFNVETRKVISEEEYRKMTGWGDLRESSGSSV